MYKDSKRTCTAIVLVIKPFVWRRSRRRRRRGLLKLPTMGMKRLRGYAVVKTTPPRRTFDKEPVHRQSRFPHLI